MDVKIEDMSKTDGENTSSEVRLTEVRRLDPRGQFKDIKAEEINLWEDVDEKEDMVRGEEFDIIGNEDYKTTNIETRT